MKLQSYCGVIYTLTPTHTHICKHAHDSKRAGMYMVLGNKPTMKQQSNCDER